HRAVHPDEAAVGVLEVDGLGHAKEQALQQVWFVEEHVLGGVERPHVDEREDHALDRALEPPALCTSRTPREPSVPSGRRTATRRAPRSLVSERKRMSRPPAEAPTPTTRDGDRAGRGSVIERCLRTVTKLARPGDCANVVPVDRPITSEVSHAATRAERSEGKSGDTDGTDFFMAAGARE